MNSTPHANADDAFPPYDTTSIKRSVWSMTSGHCFYCGLRTNPFATFSIDHIYPRCLGGSDDIRNLVPCCRRCNSSKGQKTIDEWSPGRPFWFLSQEYEENWGTTHAMTIQGWIEDRFEETDNS